MVPVVSCAEAAAHVAAASSIISPSLRMLDLLLTIEELITRLQLREAAEHDPYDLLPCRIVERGELPYPSVAPSHDITPPVGELTAQFGLVFELLAVKPVDVHEALAFHDQAAILPEVLAQWQ